MQLLCDAACGGVGPEGHTLSEMFEEWNRGRVAGNDAMYDVCQAAYRLLEQGLENHRN